MRSAAGIQKGFTLIELVVAMVIIALLAGIAIPSYMESVRKAKRNQAQIAVTGLAHALERYFTNCNTYNGSAAAPCAATIDASNVPTIYPANVPQTGTAFYALTVAIPTGGASYTITASAVTGGQMDGDKCGNFTYTSDGLKGVTGTAAVTDCWK